MKLCILGLFLILLSVPPAIGKTCCLPPQWQAIEMYLIGSSYNETYTVTTGTVKAYFDNEMKKIAYSLEESSTRGSLRNQFSIKDYHTKTQYDIIDGQCTKSQIYDPYPIQCVPGDASVVLSSSIEIEKMNVTTTRYIIPEVPDFNKAYLTIIEDACIPLSYQISGQIEGADAVKSADIYGFSMGINSTIFDVPSICKKGKQKQQVKHREMYQLSWFNM